MRRADFDHSDTHAVLMGMCRNCNGDGTWWDDRDKRHILCGVCDGSGIDDTEYEVVELGRIGDPEKLERDIAIRREGGDWEFVWFCELRPMAWLAAKTLTT
jgi:hypothetical protein